MKIIELSNETRVQVAEYSEQEILEYQNPLIEALPPIYSQQEIIERLCIYPPYSKEERYLEDYKRFHLIQRVLHYFQPLPIHLQIYSAIDRLLRMGYVSRNPLTKNYAKAFIDNQKNIQNRFFSSTPIQTGQTLSIIGISGVGKTRTLQRIFEMFPTVISHTSYKGNPLNMYEITNLTIQTPFDGSVKTIVYDFFYQIDLLMGTNYFERYANSRLSTSQLMPIVASIARSGNLGCILIDEVQNLKSMKGKGSIQILNFLTTLINTVNIPIIMIGTPKTMDILQSQFRQARRNTNIGNVMWDRLMKDEIWELFVQGMWKYQWTREIVPFNQEFSSILYQESQGIADIAVKLFMMVQVRAISSGEEKISIDLIKRVSQEELKMVQPMLMALKNRNYRKLADYDDLTFPDIEQFLEKEQITLDQKQIMESLKQGVAQKNKQVKLIDNAVFQLNILGIAEQVARETVSNIIEGNPQISSDLSKIVQTAFRILTLSETKDIEPNEEDLRRIVEQGRKNELSPYQALKEAGIIKLDYQVGDAS